MRDLMPQRVLAAVSLLALAGCRCTPEVVTVAPAELVATPMRLVLAPAYLGQRSLGVVSVVNRGGATGIADVSISAPFTADPSHLELVRGAAAAVTVAFAPTEVGRVSGTLQLGSLAVEVEAEGLAVPACLPTSVCADARFDSAEAQCVEVPKEDGTSCETRCLTGACSGGTCLGQLKGCDGGDACTVPTCDEALGCSTLPRVCPQPTAPCQVASCDAATGCGAQDAPDGTLCGPDDCTATQVDVCIVGQCVPRTRPDTGRCANRWVPTSIPGRSDHAVAFDEARGRVVLFGGWQGGALSDTWEWDGTSWVQRFPATSPSARAGHAMAYDAQRQRVVLFGGRDAAGQPASDTWEWDGSTWVQRAPPTSPPGRWGQAMAYDGAHRRVVLFGGGDAAGLPFSDTWEWDGTTWAQRSPAQSPPARGAQAMAYDALRQRVVLFGGWDGTSALADTWEWDGATWTQRAPTSSAPARASASMAYDAARRRIVLFGGASLAPVLPTPTAETWEWDGAAWVQRLSATAPPARWSSGMAYDAARQRIVLFGGGDRSGVGDADTWEWGGAAWVERTPSSSPPRRRSATMASDSGRQRVLLFGGADDGPGWRSVRADSWEWDGAAWTQRAPAISPPGRSEHAMAYDAARQRVVLFGGFPGTSVRLADTWEWDGASWALGAPATSPSGRSGAALAYDAAHQRAVLFGGTDGSAMLSDTWAWDGSTWTLRAPATSPPARGSHAMAYDAAHQRVVLFGGLTSTTLGTALSDTWEWDDVTWAPRAPATSPPPRFGHAMAYDTARQRVVLFGGEGPNAHLADTWEWDSATWWQRLPVASPPAGGGQAMAYDEARQRMTLFDGVNTWLLLP